METSQFQIKAQEFGPKALLVALFVVSVFSSTSFAAEVKMSPVKSCAGEAEPNFFHLDDSGFEDVEFAFQDSEFGPSLRFGDHQIFFSALGAKDPSQSQGPNKKGGDWTVISKTPQQFGPGGKNAKPNEAFTPFKQDAKGKGAIGGVQNFDEISLNVNGQQVRLQVREKKDADGNVLETEMFLQGSGGTKIKLTPETQKSGKTVTAKMKAEAFNVANNKIVGRTEAAVKGSLKENAQGANEKYKFAACQNLLKQGKQAKSKYRVPKYTKDLNGDHHIIGAQQGPNNQFKPEDADNQQHASYRQKSNGTPDTPIRKLATR